MTARLYGRLAYIDGSLIKYVRRILKVIPPFSLLGARYPHLAKGGI